MIMTVRTTKTILTALALAGSLLAGGTTRAQMALRDQVEQELTRNQEMLAEAFSLVNQTNSIKARSSLRTAAFIQGQARQMFNQAEELLRNGKALLAYQAMVKAKDLVFKAREAILRTIALAKEEARKEHSALRAMEMARKRLEEAESAARETDSRGATRKMLEQARIQLERARDNMREHLYGVAFQLARSSEDLSSRALALMRRGRQLRENLSAELDKTEAIVERLAERLERSPDPWAQALLRQARKLQQKARRAAKEGRPRLALEMTLRSRETAFRALRTISSTPEREAVLAALGLTDQLLERAADMGADHKALARALTLQQKARRALDRGDATRAMRLTRKARDAARKALRREERPLRVEGVKKALEKTDRLLAQVKEQIQGSSDEQASALYTRATRRQAEAWKELEAGRLKRALAQTRLAATLAREALEEIGDEKL